MWRDLPRDGVLENQASDTKVFQKLRVHKVAGPELSAAPALKPYLEKEPNDEPERIHDCTCIFVDLVFPSVEYHHPKVGFQHQYSHPPDLT